MKLRKLLAIVQAEAGPGTCSVSAGLWNRAAASNNEVSIHWRFTLGGCQGVRGKNGADALARFRAREAELRDREARAGE